MKLQFDPNQPFQLDAVAAIADLFDGQPQGGPEYSAIRLGLGEGFLVGQEHTELDSKQKRGTRKSRHA